MRRTALLLALSVAMTVVPPASATSLYDANMAHLLALHPLASEAQLAEVVGMLTASGVRLGDEAQVAGAGGLHAGEIWTLCQDVGWFFGGSNPCVLTGVVSTGVLCSSVPAHWALYVWTPSALTWTVTGGTPGFTFTYVWTEGHVGVGPSAVDGNGTFYGSGCLFHFVFGPGDELVAGYGDGVWDPAA